MNREEEEKGDREIEKQERQRSKIDRGARETEDRERKRRRVTEE